MIVPVSTRTHHAGDPTAIALPVAETGLSLDGYALCLHVRVLDQRKLGGRAGQVSEVKLSEIEAALNFVFGLG